MSGSAHAADSSETRVLLWVTTRRDADIARRLLKEVGLEGHACESLADLAAEITRGAAALLTTEEAATVAGVEAFVRLVHPEENGLDLPTVILTPGREASTVAGALQLRLQNLTILERPAPVSSIMSAVQSAVRVRRRQRELVHQMRNVRDLQAQLSLAMAASEMGTFHCGFPLDKIVWDAQCKAHFWLPPDAEVDFDTFYRILHPDDRERTRRAIEACVERREKYDVEYRTVSPRGEIRWIRATGQTRLDAQGNPEMFSGTTQDISARKSLEQERDSLLTSERSARIAGERANRLKDEFLATLGHELRTPLNAIMGWVELLKVESNDPATIEEGVQVIERNVRAQSQLIDDLLDVSRIISGKVRLNIKPLRLEEVLRAALETVRPAAMAKGVVLESTVPPDAPAVLGDFGRLQQVVWNLLTNAVKFTPRGGAVRLRLERSEGLLGVSVTDTGEGIDRDFLPYVFERFRQADGSESRQHGGLGLGLSIVKTLVEMHGGQVAVRSEGKHKGATFNFSIPIRGAGAQGTEGQPGDLQLDSAPRAAGRPDLSGVKVLVVDDEPDARVMMHRLLASCRATSFEAASAEEALRIVGDSHPDLILSDIGMPGTDGYQFIREARRSGVTTPAVALTAFARSEDRVRSIHAGFQAHLAKPIEPAELLALVASLSGRVQRLS